MPREVISKEDEWHLLTEDGNHLVSESSSYAPRCKAKTFGSNSFWKKYYYFYWRDKKRRNK
jgi:hypothetical protein